ncbi:MAG: MFS transporter [Bacteroidetes bacterium]|nr:MFS transporter [Bacteroidota bacterium]
MKLSPFWPINPKYFHVYYGWILLPMAVIGVLMSMPGQTAGFSAFTEPLLEITNFTRTQLALVYLIGTITSGFLLPLMGSILDRWGSRKMMMFASIMLGFSLFWLSYIDRIAALFPSQQMLIYLVLITFGIFSLRFFGQGLLPITANTMVGKWFDRKRGRAFAFMGVINSLAFSATPAIMTAFVVRFEWNGAWRLLSLAVGVGLGMVSWIFYRNTPEECGLVVDGLSNPSKPDDKPIGKKVLDDSVDKLKDVFGLTRRQAVRTRSFWAIVLVLSTNALVGTGLTFHIQAFGMQAGLSLAKAVAIFIPVSFIAVPMSFVAAMLTVRIHARWFVYVMAICQLFAYLAIFFLNTTTGYILTIIFLGISSGLMGPIQSAVIPKIFGRLHLGSLNGLVTSIMVIMSALGPMFLSAVNDITGSLRIGVTLLSILPVITLILSFRMPERFNAE